MMNSAMGYITLAILTMASEVLADYEHTCSIGELMSGDPRNICGSHLTNLVYQKCGGSLYMGNSDYEYYYRRKRETSGLFVSSNNANSYLRTKRSINENIVCECCIHTCTNNELNQYCDYNRKKRSVKEIVTGKSETESSRFTESEVEDFYKNLGLSEIPESEEMVTKKSIYTSREEYINMMKLEYTKRKNIAIKHEYMLQHSGSNAPTMHKTAEQTTTPLKNDAKSSNTKSASTSKPSIEEPHKLRHKYKNRHRARKQYFKE